MECEFKSVAHDIRDLFAGYHQEDMHNFMMILTDVTISCT